MLEIPLSPLLTCPRVPIRFNRSSLKIRADVLETAGWEEEVKFDWVSVEGPTLYPHFPVFVPKVRVFPLLIYFFFFFSFWDSLPIHLLSFQFRLVMKYDSPWTSGMWVITFSWKQNWMIKTEAVMLSFRKLKPMFKSSSKQSPHHICSQTNIIRVLMVHPSLGPSVLGDSSYTWNSSFDSWL